MIPPNEKIIEKKKCIFSGKEFTITDQDLYLLDRISPIFGGKKYSLPSPNLSPEMRYLNRLIWRNERTFFQRKCSKTAENIISIHHSEVPFPVYSQHVWWGDDWSGLDYGQDFDDNRPFFTQFKELYDKVPQIALNSPGSENSIYTNQSQYLKDCYLCFCSDQSKLCFHGMWLQNAENCVDCSYIQFCDNCYEVLNVTRSNGCFYSQNLINCTDIECSRDCQLCQKCFGCINLKNASYHIFNKEISKEEYEKQVRELRQDPELQNKIQDFFSNHPHKYYSGFQNEIFSGDYILNSKNVVSCFNVRDCEFIRHSQDAHEEKYCTDLTETLTQDFCINIEGSNNNSNCGFCMKINDTSHTWYSSHIYGSQNLFGCIGLKQQKYCLLNKAYSEHEWGKLTDRVIQHMLSTKEWGQHFSPHLSPFAYNISMAGEYFPMTEKQVQNMKWNWHPEKTPHIIDGIYTPLPIEQYNERIVGFEIAKTHIEEILNGMIICTITHKPFKIIRQELAFYIENNLPIPTKHHDQRYKERMYLRNSRKLFERQCAECQKDIVTTYTPERPEKVVCEECYRKLVY